MRRPGLALSMLMLCLSWILCSVHVATSQEISNLWQSGKAAMDRVPAISVQAQAAGEMAKSAMQSLRHALVCPTPSWFHWTVPASNSCTPEKRDDWDRDASYVASEDFQIESVVPEEVTWIESDDMADDTATLVDLAEACELDSVVQAEEFEYDFQPVSAPYEAQPAVTPQDFQSTTESQLEATTEVAETAQPAESATQVAETAPQLAETAPALLDRVEEPADEANGPGFGPTMFVFYVEGNPYDPMLHEAADALEWAGNCLRAASNYLRSNAE